MGKSNREIDNLSHEFKMMVCDNCEESNTCNKAYTGFFNKKKCYQSYKNVKEYMDDEEVEED